MRKYPILILHGWNLSENKFHPLTDNFQKNGYTVYAPDLPGFGKNSSLSKPLVLENYVQFVIEYLKKKKISQYIAIGHSFGGRIALKLAADSPQKIKLMILTGVPGFVPVPRLKIFIFSFISKIGNIFLSIPPLFYLRKNAKRLLYKLAGSSDYMRTGGAMRTTFKSIIKEDLVQYMKRINIPTLLVWGEADRTVPISVAMRMEKTIKKSRLIIIPKAIHNFPYTEPEKFIESIEDFIRQ